MDLTSWGFLISPKWVVGTATILNLQNEIWVQKVTFSFNPIKFFNLYKVCEKVEAYTVVETQLT